MADGGAHASAVAIAATAGALRDERLIELRATSRSRFGTKRIVDVALSLLLLVVLAPLIVVVAIAVKLDSRGPLFYRCRRVGFRGRDIDMLKFRKMRDGAKGPRITTAGDRRFTRCGRFLAATKLDELPQLWHVLIGEMSLVGPRPEDAAFVGLHVAAYEEIVQVRPGLTGLSQLAFACEAKLLDSGDAIPSYVNRLLPAKVQLDLIYARNKSLRMDLSILVWTGVAVVLRQDVAVNRASGELTLRRRPRPQSREVEGEVDVSC